MSVEFIVVFPVALAIALVATNAIGFFGDCASFDREARNAVRVYATSPAYGQSSTDAAGPIQAYLSDQMDDEFATCTVAVDGRSGGLMRFTATLTFHPNLFGLGMRSEVLGVPLPSLKHGTSLTVDPYNPGVVF